MSYCVTVWLIFCYIPSTCDKKNVHSESIGLVHRECQFAKWSISFLIFDDLLVSLLYIVQYMPTLCCDHVLDE